MCHVANRALTDVETRYGQTELEAVAIKFACVHAFYKYLVGAPTFEIITDCKPVSAPLQQPNVQSTITYRVTDSCYTGSGLRSEVPEGSRKHRRLWVKPHQRGRTHFHSEIPK